MIFLPYKADLKLSRIPIVTVLISLLCIGIYYQQEKNQTYLFSTVDGFCVTKQPEMFKLALHAVAGRASPQQQCVDVMMGMHMAKDRDVYLSDAIKAGRPLSGFNRKNSNRYVEKILRDNYAEFEQKAPPYLTNTLSYKPQSWDPLHMITAAVAHGSWDHVIGNLIFFFAFAITLEAILGYIYFPVVLAAIAILSHVFLLADYAERFSTTPHPWVIGSCLRRYGHVCIFSAHRKDTLFFLACYYC